MCGPVCLQCTMNKGPVLLSGVERMQGNCLEEEVDKVTDIYCVMKGGDCVHCTVIKR